MYAAEVSFVDAMDFLDNSQFKAIREYADNGGKEDCADQR
jgi:hypothetical protein